MADQQDRVILVEAFRALANPNRLSMYLELLQQQKTSVRSCALQDLVARLEVGAPTVSHHVRELVRAGLVTVERDGKYLHCSLDETMRNRLAEFFTAGNSTPD